MLRPLRQAILAHLGNFLKIQILEHPPRPTGSKPSEMVFIFEVFPTWNDNHQIPDKVTFGLGGEGDTMGERHPRTSAALGKRAFLSWVKCTEM